MHLSSLCDPCFRSTDRDQQDLDLINEPLTRIDQRLINSTVHPERKIQQPSISSRGLKSSPTPVVIDRQPRPNKPLSSTTNHVYLVSPSTVRYAHQQLRNESAGKSSERLRTFVHRSNSRPFVLGTAIQMKPITNSSSSNDRHRLSDQVYPYQGSSRTSPPQSSGYPMVDRGLSSSQSSTKSLSLDSSDERRAWSVREKAKLFEHGSSSQKLSTGRENYVWCISVMLFSLVACVCDWTTGDVWYRRLSFLPLTTEANEDNNDQIFSF